MRFLSLPFLILSSLAWGASPSPTPSEAAKPELVIYSYDTLLSSGGLGQTLFPRFEAKCGCRIRAVSVGDGGQLLTRLQLDQRRGKPTAHVVFGIDQQIWSRAKGLLQNWAPPSMPQVVPEIQVEPGFVPFDYGVFALMADTQKLAALKLAPPKSLEELAEPRYKKQLLLQDPRTSTPGLAFLLYTRATKTDVNAFWKKFRGQWLTLAPGWDEAYGMFLKGEAPLVWSYTTSEAYHREHGDEDGRYRAVLFEEGQPLQIEGAALVKGAPGGEQHQKLGRDFLEFLLSEEAQSVIPIRQWMLPVRKSMTLSKSFTDLPKPKKIVRISSSAEEIRQALGDWSKSLQLGH